MAVVIVYGSLFPFDFQQAHTSVAEMFGQWNPWLDRADASDNVLLFVPLGLALHFGFDRRVVRWLAGALAWLVLGLGLQWAQLFVPGRVASLADAINNALGLLVGLALGRLLAPWLARRRLLKPGWDAFALLLVAAWYGYESFPFLPTLDLSLLRGHVKTAFDAPFEPLRLLRHAVAATLGTMLLLRAELVDSRWAAVAGAAGLLLLSELLVPYGTLHAWTLLGIAAGLAAGERIERWTGGQPRWPAAALALMALALTVATPFRGQPEAPGFTLTPFSSLLWYGTTSGIPPAAFEALAIGALLWAGLPHAAVGQAAARRWPWVVLALLGGAEALRVGVFGYRGDTTTFALWAVLAPVATMLGGPRRAPAPDNAPPAQPPSQPAARQAPPTTPSKANNGGQQAAQPGRARWHTGFHAMVAWLGLSAGLWLVLRVPTIPYNVKELLDPGNRWAIPLFAAALLWLGIGPWWVATAAGRRRRGAAWLPVMLFGAAMLSLLLLLASVTQESLDDIVGSPDLYRRITQDEIWGAQWRAWLTPWPAASLQALERSLRYAALYGVMLIPLAVAAMQLCGHWHPRQRLSGLAVAAVGWWLAKLIVVDWAISDNLTELIAENGVPYLAALLLLLSANVAVAAAASGRRGVAGALLITGLFIPATWWLLAGGLESLVIKHGLVFSAQQFLLGQNRSARLGEWQLFTRWAALYLAAVIVIACGMRLARRLMAPPSGGTAVSVAGTTSKPLAG